MGARAKERARDGACARMRRTLVCGERARRSGVPNRAHGRRTRAYPQPRLAVPAASLEGCCREAGCHPADAALRWDPGLPTGASTSGLSGSPSQDACQSVWDLRVCGEDTLRDLHTAHLIQVNNQAAAGLD